MAGSVNVTLVFSDLVGSTELAARLGAEQADALRQVHFSLLREAIAASGGREIKNLGDGLMAAFPSAGAGLDAAVAMQQAVDRHNRRGDGEPLSIRIGVAAGDATEDDGDYFGEPVVQAARLCARAEASQILGTDVLRLLTPRGGPHRFEPLGELELKGLPEPVAACAVRWQPAPAGRDFALPLPARLVAGQNTAFVGRATERDRLTAAYKDVEAGDHRIVLLSGEAGMGKTRLCAELARHAHDHGAVVLYGRSDEDLGIPYQPWVEALAHLFEHAPDHVLARHDATQLTELARLVPDIRRRRPDLTARQAPDSDADRYLLFSSVSGVLATVAARCPVVIVLDDLHWADRTTLQLLRHEAGSVPGSVLVVGTYRQTDVGADQPLGETLAALHREPAVERIPLNGLSDVEVVSLLEAAAGHEMDRIGVALAHALRRETDGNPFFVGELLRHLAESGTIAQQADGRWATTVELDQVGLPESIRAVVGRRVRRLGEPAHRVLATAAVIGRDFDLQLLAATAELTEDAVLDVVEPAVRAGVVSEVPEQTDRFTFTHALIQHTLYADLSASRRTRLHRRVAGLLEQMAGDDPGERVGELANHWLAATQPADLDKAIDYAARAGDRALATLAPDEAARWYRQGLDALAHQAEPNESLRCRLLTGLGDAQRQAGEPFFRETLLDAGRLAQHLGEKELLVRAALANNRGSMSAAGVVDHEKVAVLHAALDAVGTDDTAERARLLATLAVELSFDPDFAHRRAAAEEAIAVARRSGDDAALLEALTRPNVSVMVPSLLDERVAWTREAVRLADQLGDPVAAFWAANMAGFTAICTRDPGGAAAWLARRVELVEQVGQPAMRWLTTISASWQALLFGDPVEAERLAMEAFQLGTESGQPDAMVFLGGQLIAVRWHQGRLAEMLPLVAQTATDNPGLPVFADLVAWVHSTEGDIDEARRIFEARRRDDFVLAYDNSWLLGTCFVADTAVNLEDRDGARLLYDRLLPFAGHVSMTGLTCEGVIDTFLGRVAALLDRPTDADAHFAASVAGNQQLRSPFHTALAQVEWSRVLVPRDPERAAALARTALATARRHGYAGIDRLAVGVLEGRATSSQRGR